MMWGLENYRSMPGMTISAMITVLMLFLFLSQSVRIIRLRDSDTLLESMRKDIARFFGSNRQIRNMSDTDIALEMERLIAEQERRKIDELGSKGPL